MSSLKEQYEQMLADEAKQKELKPVSEFDEMKKVLKSAGFFMYALEKNDLSVEAAGLVLPEKWRALSGYTSTRLNEHLVFPHNNRYEIDLDVVAQVRGDDGKSYMAATLDSAYGFGTWRSSSFCSTKPDGGFRPLANNQAKKKCLQKAEDCMDLLEKYSQGSQLFVMDKKEIDRSDSGVPHYCSIILFRDGSYTYTIYGACIRDVNWLEFLKRVNGK